MKAKAVIRFHNSLLLFFPVIFSSSITCPNHSTLLVDLDNSRFTITAQNSMRNKYIAQTQR